MKMFYDMKRLAEPHKSFEFISQYSYWFYKLMKNSSKKNLQTLELHYEKPSILVDHWLFGF